MQAAPELLQVGDRAREPALRMVERCQCVTGGGCAGMRELRGETGQPPLGAPAEAMLEASPLCISGDEQPAAGGLELVSLGAYVPLELGVRRREACGARDCVGDVGVGEDLGVVDERRHRRTVSLDRRHDPAGSFGRQHDGLTSPVDPAAVSPVGDLQTRVAECMCECVSNRGPACLAEFDHQIGDRRPQPPGAYE